MQSHYETPLLERLGGRVDGDGVLEIGCGRGVGIGLILNRFGAARVDAFDLDREMVASAQRHLASYGDWVTVRVGDTTAIDAPDATDGAVTLGSSITSCAGAMR